MDYREGEADASKVYLILEEETADLIARVELPNTYTMVEAENQLGKIARALGGQWWSE